MSEVKFEPVRRTLELTPEQQRVILEVLRYNHAYYVRNHDMQPHCMWPGEVLAEMINALAFHPVNLTSLAARPIHGGGAMGRTGAD